MLRHGIAVSLVGAAAFGVALAGCHSASSVKADASGTAAAQAKQSLSAIAAKCGTSTASGQLAAARDMKSKSGRAALMAKCGVPPANRSALETKALSAAETAHLTTKAGRTTYFTVTLPKLVQEEQA